MICDVCLFNIKDDEGSIISTENLAGIFICNKCLTQTRHLKESCTIFIETGRGCDECFCDNTCNDLGCTVCGGNSPTYIDAFIDSLAKIKRNN